jgi:hypothetical protein
MNFCCSVDDLHFKTIATKSEGTHESEMMLSAPGLERYRYDDNDPGFEYDWMPPEEDPSEPVSAVIKNETDHFDNDPETDFRGDLKITTVWENTCYKMIPHSIIPFKFQDRNADFLHDYDNASSVTSDSDVDGEIDDDVIDVDEDEPEDLHELEEQLATEVCSSYLFALELYSNHLRVKTHLPCLQLSAPLGYKKDISLYDSALPIVCLFLSLSELITNLVSFQDILQAKDPGKIMRAGEQVLSMKAKIKDMLIHVRILYT